MNRIVFWALVLTLVVLLVVGVLFVLWWTAQPGVWCE